jgi:hypothetical protein
MIYESAESVPVTQDFTMAEYQRQELSKQDSFEARAVDFLQRVRREMATGRFDNTSQLREYRQAPIRDQQAVQTETDRPLTIRLHARNEARTGWFTRFIQFGLGFVILWIGAALALRLRPTRS